MTSVAVLGLGRMGSAMAARLADDHDVRTWTRSGGGSPTHAVEGAEVVLLCLYDGPACREVLAASLPALSAGTTVVNTTTVGPDEAAELEVWYGERGGVPARARHGLDPGHRRRPADDPRRRQAVGRGRGGAGAGWARRWCSAARPRRPGSSSSPTGCSATRWRRCVGLSLVVRRSGCRATPSSTSWAARSSAGSSTAGATCSGEGARPPATFAAGALAKDLALLGTATDTVPDSLVAVDTLLSVGALEADDDISVVGVAAPDLTWLADARLDVSPEVVADADVLRPLHAYARTHATGDPAYLDDAFLPTAHVEGYRDGELRLLDPRRVPRRVLRLGRRRRDEPLPTHRAARRTRLGRHRRDDAAPRRGRLHRRVRAAAPARIGQWRIANKAYERR